MDDKETKRCVKRTQELSADICPFGGLEKDCYCDAPGKLPAKSTLSGRYILGKIIGKGYFTNVYLGYDLILNNVVAIKEYYPRAIIGFGDRRIHVNEDSETYKKGLERFYDQVRAFLLFKDIGNVVSIRDYFRENNTAYIIMDYIKGLNLREYVSKNGRMTGETALNLMKPVIETMQKIHGMGMIHRDICPDNIIYSDNKLVLIDFGSATWTKKHNKTNIVVFKRGFSPEEQYGTNVKIDERSDVYSICATIYYMLTGKIPADAIRRKIGEKIDSLEEMDDILLSCEQKKAVMKGLSVNANERYDNLAQLAKDIFMI